MRINVKRLRRALTALLLLASLSLTTLPSFAQNYSAASDSLVILSPAEADSLIAVLDNYEVRLQLLQVDLDECRVFARLDSLQIKSVLDASNVPWYEKIAKHPILWFGLGVFLTVSAQNLQ